MVHVDAQEASEEATTAEQDTPEGIVIDIQARLTISTTGEILVHTHVLGATDARETACFKLEMVYCQCAPPSSPCPCLSNT
jgi:hypothetical protein